MGVYGNYLNEGVFSNLDLEDLESTGRTRSDGAYSKNKNEKLYEKNRKNKNDGQLSIYDIKNNSKE